MTTGTLERFLEMLQLLFSIMLTGVGCVIMAGVIIGLALIIVIAVLSMVKTIKQELKEKREEQKQEIKDRKRG